MADVTIQRSPDSPFETVDDSLLVKTDGVVDNGHERTTWVEYRFPDSDVVVHRSVHVTLKEGVQAFSELGEIG